MYQVEQTKSSVGEDQSSSTAALVDEEADACGDLPGNLTSAIGIDPSLVELRQSSTTSGRLLSASPLTSADTMFAQRRSSEFYPAGSNTGRLPGGVAYGRQARRDRRLSDPGRLAVPLLRLSLHHQQMAAAAAGVEYPSNGGGSPQPGCRLSDPRLAAIRCLFGSSPCEVGEALAPPTSLSTSPPQGNSPTARSPRSRSPTSPSEITAQQRHARWDTRRLSLPNPQPFSLSTSPNPIGRSPLATASWLLPTEVNEAMGAVSGSPSAVAVAAGAVYPLCGSPPLSRPFQTTVTTAASSTGTSSAVTVSSSDSPASGFAAGLSSGTSSGSPTSTLSGSITTTAAAALRRRRSVSLDQGGGNGSPRLEAITEENAAAGIASKSGTGSSVTATASLPSMTRKGSTPVASSSYD